MSYKIETHLHTAEASKCGVATGEEQAIYRKKDGYDTIIVTDHFYRGNTCVDRDLPWEQFVNNFSKGYENAKAKGDEIGLNVLFGWEENFGAGEMLVYGLDKEWMLEHPEMTTWTPKEHYNHIHKAGGFVVQAHPFRVRWYNEGIHLYPEYCDAFEVINLSNEPVENTRAKWYAKEYKKNITGGSDIHNIDPLNGGIISETKIETIEDYINLIKSGNGYQVIGYDEF